MGGGSVRIGAMLSGCAQVWSHTYAIDLYDHPAEVSPLKVGVGQFDKGSSLGILLLKQNVT